MNPEPAPHVTQSVKELWAILGKHWTEFRQAERNNLRAAIFMGHILVKAKAQSVHGDWSRNLDALKMSSQRASEFMRIAKSPDPGISQCESIKEALELAKDYNPEEDRDEPPDNYKDKPTPRAGSVPNEDLDDEDPEKKPSRTRDTGNHRPAKGPGNYDVHDIPSPADFAEVIGTFRGLVERLVGAVAQHKKPANAAWLLGSGPKSRDFEDRIKRIGEDIEKLVEEVTHFAMEQQDDARHAYRERR